MNNRYCPSLLNIVVRPHILYDRMIEPYRFLLLMFSVGLLIVLPSLEEDYVIFSMISVFVLGSWRTFYLHLKHKEI